MKIKLTTPEDVKNFCNVTAGLESDVFVGVGRYVVDGKSILGIFSLNLAHVLDVTVVEKKDGETEQLKNKLSEMGWLM